MCGIIGYTGYRQASWIAYEALLRLEYRGYDSVGMAVAGEEAIEVRKDIGKVAEVNNLVHFKEMKGTTGIGHTRWATHGGVTKTNAHPHISNNQEIVVIHNGIVENYQELKQLLEKEGFSFYSETDTEIIPNLIEYEMSKGKSFQQATMDTVKQLKGYYAVLTMHLGEKKIIGTRNGS
ncbi:class II glutamine amidotransferase, partial [Candidatus Bathyarchaeota archaeon]|nr:class II glutamine amidotransferase [Candidatus Bathyarchaeota archaeon]